MTECYLAKIPEDLERRYVMDVLLEKPIFQVILLADGSHSEIMPSLGFHAKRDPTIRVKMFITLEKFSDFSKVGVRMFITL